MVATILLLALTVTLFSAIFAFVTSFPAPPAQNANQFQASLQITSNGTYIKGVNITHLAGPPVSSNGLIYFKSARNPGNCPFTGPATVGQGIQGSIWTLGQVWSLSFGSFCGHTTLDQIPDNITIYVVSQANLIFSVVLPGQQIVTPPAIISTWSSPDPVAAGSSFSVYATISGSVKPNSVYVNLASIPGLPTTPQPMTLSGSQWTYTTSSGAKYAGSYTGLINLTGTAGQTNVATVPVVVSSSGSSFFVSIAALPTSGYAPLTVSFATTQSGGTPPFNYTWTFGDGNTSYAMNPSHVYTTTGTYLASLVVTDKNGNVSSASTSITAKFNLKGGVVTWSSSATVNVGNCRFYGGSSCPTLYWKAWNNMSIPVTVSGMEYANASGVSQNYWGSWTIPSTPISAGTATGTLSISGANPWRLSSQTPPGATYVLTVVLTFKNQSGTVLGTLVYSTTGFTTQ